MLDRKCLVGLEEKVEESMQRYEKYFHWHEGVSSSETKEGCLRQFLDDEREQRKEHPTYIKGSKAWEALRKNNEYDMHLYEYAQHLYQQQQMMLFNV